MKYIFFQFNSSARSFNGIKLRKLIKHSKIKFTLELIVVVAGRTTYFLYIAESKNFPIARNIRMKLTTQPKEKIKSFLLIKKLKIYE